MNKEANGGETLGDECDLELLETLLDGTEDIDEHEKNTEIKGKLEEKPVEKKAVSSSEVLIANIHNGDTDSSDDEDNRYFENQKYNEYGRNIKNIINSNENNAKSALFVENSKKSNKQITWSSKVQTSTVKPSISNQKLDVYSDPIFGIRIINPLITSRQLQEKMTGRTAVTMASVKRHILNGGADGDWVIAGIVVGKSPIRTSQKGSQYCIWTISDLKADLKTVSVFFFRNSHKNLWKTPIGTVVGILNPSVMEDSKGKDEATLAVDNAQKVLILGVSKDYGVCKAKKKNGEDCTAFVNINKCSYCIYHVQQEYKKCSRRSELQAPGLGNGLNALRNKILGKNEVFYGGRSFSAVPAVPNKKQVAKDTQKLLSLQPTGAPASGFAQRMGSLKLKDKNLLKTLSTASVSKPAKEEETPLRNSTTVLNCQPKLGDSVQVDLSLPINKCLVSRAKLSALEWVKKNGKFNKVNPNEVRKKNSSVKRIAENSPPEERANKILKLSNNKRTEKDEIAEEVPKKKLGLPSQFMELLAAKSKHFNLVEASDANAQEQYFNQLEKKEKLEEKMLNTYKVPCKAVTCLKCKYTAFSASELCKRERHPLQVKESCKRFFSCKNCKNRIATLELVPLLTCKQCSQYQWERTTMMKEKNGKLPAHNLSIRGGEETFIGSLQTDGNLNLLVPE